MDEKEIRIIRKIIYSMMIHGEFWRLYYTPRTELEEYKEFLSKISNGEIM